MVENEVGIVFSSFIVFVEGIREDVVVLLCNLFEGGKDCWGVM